jgi:hypothetical protein
MKKISIISLVAVTLLIVNCSVISAQFVGDASPAQAVSTPGKKPGTVIFKFGTMMPGSDNKISPTTAADVAAGKLGMQNGFMVEAGYGLDLMPGENKVGFYYVPILAAYFQNKLNWEGFDLYGASTRPFSAIEIAQRYGVFYKPVKDVEVAGYYRPAGIIPLGFKFASDNTSAQASAEMSVNDDAPVFMMSHTFGLIAKYKFVALSFEFYKAQPTFDIKYGDAGATMVKKIPVRYNIISLSFVL